MENRFVVNDLGLNVGILEDMVDVGEPAVAPAIGPATGEHLGSEAVENGDVALDTGDVKECGAQGLDDVLDKAGQLVLRLGMGEPIAAG